MYILNLSPKLVSIQEPPSSWGLRRKHCDAGRARASSYPMNPQQVGGDAMTLRSFG